MSYLIEQLNELVNAENKWIISKVEQIKEAPDGAKRWLKDLSKNDIEHAKNVELYLGKIVKESRIKLTPEDIYLLILAVYTHDVGYRIDPSIHPQKSFDEIIAHPEKFFIQDPDLAKAVAFIGLTHGIDDLNKIPMEFSIDFLNKTEKFNLRFLGSLLRLADDIDEGYLRVESRINQENNPRNSVYHVEIGPQVIRLETRPNNKEEWEKLNRTKNHIQKRINEIRDIIYPNGVKIDKIELFPHSWEECAIESRKSLVSEDYEIKDIPINGSKSVFMDVGIRSFSRGAENLQDETDRMLCLMEFFEGRYIKQDYSWNKELFNELNEFISQNITPENKYRLHLDTHMSIAFFAGYLLDSKTGVEIYPMQKTREGKKFWYPVQDSKMEYEEWEVIETELNKNAKDVALVLGVSHDISNEVAAFIKEKQISVSKIINCKISGSRSNVILDGFHAKKLASDLSIILKKSNPRGKKDIIHIFASCPAGFMFYLGQLARSFGKIILYEHDFEDQRSEAYSPSFELPI